MVRDWLELGKLHLQGGSGFPKRFDIKDEWEAYPMSVTASDKYSRTPFWWWTEWDLRAYVV